MERKPILSVKNLKTYFYTDDGVVRGCDGVSYDVYPGETLAVVGESGSGKSVTAMSILDLVPKPVGRIVEGEILFDGLNLVGLGKEEMRKIRGNDIATIFQEPMTSLNPVLTVGYQIMESILLHQDMNKKEAKSKAIDLLELVGIPSPESRINDYPHQMSGGMRQRVMIAIALACNPKVLIADEPTTALDVTIQAQILRLIRKLQKELNMAVILITHDLGVVAQTADQVAVMYAGKIVEYGTVDEIFHNGKHPYLMGLKKSIPRLDIEMEELATIEGMVPSPLNLPKGCKFAPRCQFAMDKCSTSECPPISVEKEHYACCFLYEKEDK